MPTRACPIRLRLNPTWFPEINHWKMAIFVGQGVVEFGSANWVTFELAPWSSTNYDDETALFSDDPAIVNAFKTRFDRMWNDTTAEPESVAGGPPYLKDWNDACANEPLGCDFHSVYPNPAPMVINTARLEPDYAMPPDLIWGQGPDFNNRLVQEINNEPSSLHFVIYRLTVDNITQALLKVRGRRADAAAGRTPEYLNRKWPEFWLTHANLDKLWAAGIPIRQRAHQGLTHMKTLVTAAYATNASSNYAAAWQRDHDYFISSATSPDIYTAIKNRVTAMWNDTVGFAPFQPQPPDAADSATPASGATNVGIGSPFVWKIAPFAVSYDVYLGTSSSTLTLVGNVPAQMDNEPADHLFVDADDRTAAGHHLLLEDCLAHERDRRHPAIAANSTIWSFTTGGSNGPPAAPTSPSPSHGATGVSTSPTLGWGGGTFGVSYNVAFGTTPTPPQVATNLAAPSYAPGMLVASTTYFWRATAVSSGGSTAGPVWQFDTGSGSGGGPAGDVVIYAGDVPAQNLHGFTQVADATAAGGTKLWNPDAGADAIGEPSANPSKYFEVPFDAAGGTRYRVWLRIHPINDSKFNDSVFVQYSDSVDQSGTAIYRTGTSSAVTVNLWTCATCATTGWGWQRNAYWLGDTGDVWFQNGGSHTLRVQVREDGVEIDQIVISPTTYATNPPGPVSGDTTIVAKPGGRRGRRRRRPANGGTGVSTNPTLTWSSSGATSYDVSFGTANPPPLVAHPASATYSTGTLNNNTKYLLADCRAQRERHGHEPGVVVHDRERTHASRNACIAEPGVRRERAWYHTDAGLDVERSNELRRQVRHGQPADAGGQRRAGGRFVYHGAARQQHDVLLADCRAQRRRHDGRAGVVLHHGHWRRLPGHAQPDLHVGDAQHRLHAGDVVRDDLECVARRAEQRLPDLVSGDSGGEPGGVLQRAGAELPEDWNNQHRRQRSVLRPRRRAETSRTWIPGTDEDVLVSGAAVREGALGFGAHLRGLLAVAE